MDKHSGSIALHTTCVNYNLHGHGYCLQEAYGTDGPKKSNLVPSPSLFQSASEYIDGPPLSVSNYLDSVPSSTVNRITGLKTRDLGTLLTALGLEKYISKFHPNPV
jgi:hypothetical protein